MLRPMRTALLIALLASLSFAGPKLAPDLPTDANAMVDVIIQFKTPPTKKELKPLGPYGQMKKVFQNINGANLQLPMSLVQALENDPNVAYISPNRTSTGMLDIVTATVNATAAWQFGLDGTGVGVAVIDSGITSKDDLMMVDGVTPRIVYSESFIGVADTTDAYGHGTHVAGIVGGNGKDSTRPRLHPDIQGRGAERQSDQPSGSGPEWSGTGSQRHRGHRSRDSDSRTRTTSALSTCLWAGPSMKATLSIRSARKWKLPGGRGSLW